MGDRFRWKVEAFAAVNEKRRMIIMVKMDARFLELAME